MTAARLERLEHALSATDRKAGELALDQFGVAVGRYERHGKRWHVRLTDGSLYPAPTPREIEVGC